MKNCLDFGVEYKVRAQHRINSKFYIAMLKEGSIKSIW